MFVEESGRSDAGASTHRRTEVPLFGCVAAMSHVRSSCKSPALAACTGEEGNMELDPRGCLPRPRVHRRGGREPAAQLHREALTPTELRTMAHCTATIRPPNSSPKRLNCTSRHRPSESSPKAVGAVGRTARPRWSSSTPMWAELHARGQSQQGSLPSRAAAVSHRTHGRQGGADGGTLEPRRSLVR